MKSGALAYISSSTLKQLNCRISPQPENGIHKTVPQFSVVREHRTDKEGCPPKMGISIGTTECEWKILQCR